MNNFQQTVNLREQMDQQKKEQQRKKMGQIEKIYNQADSQETKKELQQISRPAIKKDRGNLFRFITIVLAIVVVAATIYWLFYRGKGNITGNGHGWYAVKLVDSTIFYGQIKDLKADPVVLANVYYNYDQTANKDQNKTVEETGNLRLVKRGNETHGPDGSMDIYHSQILYLELLKSDSKVLKAILEYEK